MKNILKILKTIFYIIPKIILYFFLLGISVVALVISIFFENCGYKLFPNPPRRHRYSDGIRDLVSIIDEFRQ